MRRKIGGIGQVYWFLNRNHVKAGLQSCAGVLLIIFSIALWTQRCQTVKGEASWPKKSALALQERSINSGRALKPAAYLAQFYHNFPSQLDLPDMTAILYTTAAGHGVMLDQGRYRMAVDKSDRSINFYEITLPVKGSYTAIRGFISQALQELPLLSFDAISLTRVNTKDSVVDAELRVSLYVRPE